MKGFLKRLLFSLNPFFHSCTLYIAIVCLTFSHYIYLTFSLSFTVSSTFVQIKLTNHIFWLHELETNTVSNLTNR